MAKTEGMHLTSPDAAVRQKTADYLVALARCCADLGGDLLVFGSPAQRRIPAGASALRPSITPSIPSAAPAGIADRGVKLCLEPLAPPEADFINTCAEAIEILDRIDSSELRAAPRCQGDVVGSTPMPDLIRRHAGRTGHFHANDPNRRGPGFGDVDFVPIFRACARAIMPVGCPSRCSITLPIRRRSRAKVCATCANAKRRRTYEFRLAATPKGEGALRARG